MGLVFLDFFFQVSEKKYFWRRSWATSVQNISSRSWIRSHEISCVPHTSFDEISQSIVKSERHELAINRGSDPPLVDSAQTIAGDVGRVPTRPLLKEKYL